VPKNFLRTQEIVRSVNFPCIERGAKKMGGKSEYLRALDLFVEPLVAQKSKNTFWEITSLKRTIPLRSNLQSIKNGSDTSRQRPEASALEGR
jgi:hypothetical protein